jgi:hypothetical protein
MLLAMFVLLLGAQLAPVRAVAAVGVLLSGA